MHIAARHVTLLALISAKSKCTVSFRLNKILLYSNKDPQNVADRLKDASKLLKVQFMFKLKVELETCSVIKTMLYYRQLHTQIRKNSISNMSNFQYFDHNLDEKIIFHFILFAIKY